MNTKERIFDVSLELFSKKGYDSVSLREIADEAGIKKSSIYAYYPSKEAILINILEYFTDLFKYDELLNSKDFLLTTDNNILLENPEQFYHMGSEAIKEMLSQERNLKIWKLILLQMHHNENIRLFFQNEILVKPLIFWNGFFTILKEKGIIHGQCNPKLLAKEYYSFPIYLLLEMYAKYDDIPQTSLDNFFEEAEAHATFLLESIKVNRK
ncbi:MAG: TetR family transcriptional regulator [Methanosphaera sp. rholeuAM270]|nr:MAG: TetR family transcriptional regulator [Methanosphaera sp. rholeuAM270]